MNNSALKYHAYKALLEADITDEQRNKLIEANIFQKIADFFGAGKDTLTTDLKKIFQNNKLNRRAATAKKNIEKEIDELKAIAKEAGVSDEAVYDMLNLTLNAKNVSPSEVASPPKTDSSSSEGGGEGGVKPGAPVASAPPEAQVPFIARAAARAAGQDPEKAAEQAQEKKVDAPKATAVLAKALSKSAGVDVAKVEKVLNFLIQNKHMVAEGRKVTTQHILKAAAEISKKTNDKMIMEKWNSLSGLNILKEEGNPVDPAKKKKFSDVLNDLRKSFKEEEMSDEDLLKIVDALDGLEDVAVK